MCEAMKQDLGRALFLNYVAEVGTLEGAARHDIVHLKTWMKDIQEDVELLLAPAAAFTRHEPMGTVTIIGSWNAPFITSLKPLISAIAAGNCAIVKPSEHSPVSAAIIKKIVEDLNQDCYVCIEGGVDVAVAINKLPSDLICFTGST